MSLGQDRVPGCVAPPWESFQKDLGSDNFYIPLPTTRWHIPMSLPGVQISTGFYRHIVVYQTFWNEEASVNVVLGSGVRNTFIQKS